MGALRSSGEILGFGRVRQELKGNRAGRAVRAPGTPFTCTQQAQLLVLQFCRLWINQPFILPKREALTGRFAIIQSGASSLDRASGKPPPGHLSWWSLLRPLKSLNHPPVSSSNHLGIPESLHAPPHPHLQPGLGSSRTSLSAILSPTLHPSCLQPWDPGEGWTWLQSPSSLWPCPEREG